jgi:hypothetical protein
MRGESRDYLRLHGREFIAGDMQGTASTISSANSTRLQLNAGADRMTSLINIRHLEALTTNQFDRKQPAVAPTADSYFLVPSRLTNPNM